MKSSHQRGSSSILLLGIIVLSITAVGFYWYKIYNNKGINLENLTKVTNQQENNDSKKVYYVYSTFETKSNKHVQEIRYVDIVSKEEGKFSTSGFPDSFPTDFRYPYYQFTPDRKHLIFLNEDNLWNVDIDGKNLKQLTTEGAPSTDEYWGVNIGPYLPSPDGKYMYYSVTQEELPSRDVEPGTDIKKLIELERSRKKYHDVQTGEYLVDFNGAKRKLDKEYTGYPLGWTPDSKNIVYAYYGDKKQDYKNKKTQIYNVNTSSVSTIFNGIIESISWNKDGTKAVFVSDYPRYSDGKVGYGDIYLANFDSELKVIESVPYIAGEPEGNDRVETDYNYEYWRPHQISPDGKYVILTRTPQVYRMYPGNDDKENSELVKKTEVFLWDTTTKQKNKLPILVDEKTSLHFTDDSKKLVYLISYDLDKYHNELYIYDFAANKKTYIMDIQGVSSKYIAY